MPEFLLKLLLDFRGFLLRRQIAALQLVNEVEKIPLLNYLFNFSAAAQVESFNPV